MAQVTTQLIVAQGTWYNSNWQYRSPIIITNPGGILTDFQVKISLGSSFPWNHTNPDGSDMRFTTSDGITEINYWIESWTLSSSASI